jgi:hypothetical protein
MVHISTFVNHAHGDCVITQIYKRSSVPAEDGTWAALVVDNNNNNNNNYSNNYYYYYNKIMIIILDANIRA